MALAVFVTYTVMALSRLAAAQAIAPADVRAIAKEASRPSSTNFEARFQLQLQGPPDFVDIVLIGQGDRLRAVNTGAEVDTIRMRELDIPLIPPLAGRGQALPRMDRATGNPVAKATRTLASISIRF
jgi:hypothetical protein